MITENLIASLASNPRQHLITANQSQSHAQNDEHIEPKKKKRRDNGYTPNYPMCLSGWLPTFRAHPPMHLFHQTQNHTSQYRFTQFVFRLLGAQLHRPKRAQFAVVHFIFGEAK